MKRLLFIIHWSLFIIYSALAQQAPTTLEGWAERLEKFGKSIPQEQVFVHMDNTCYFLGDTIYYKGYVRRSDTGTPSRISGVLYVELLNQDGYLVERQQLELQGGQANGSFVLQDTLYGMKWDYLCSNDIMARGWHQYASDPYWPSSIASLMNSCYAYCAHTPSLTYAVPRYK